MGLVDDIHLTGDNYQWLSSMFVSSECPVISSALKLSMRTVFRVYWLGISNESFVAETPDR